MAVNETGCRPKRHFLNALLSRFGPGLDAEWLFQSKYGAGHLKGALTRILKERRLGEAQCRLAIPSVDLTAGKIVVFKTPWRPQFRPRRYRELLRRGAGADHGGEYGRSSRPSRKSALRETKTQQTRAMHHRISASTTRGRARRARQMRWCSRGPTSSTSMNGVPRNGGPAVRERADGGRAGSSGTAENLPACPAWGWGRPSGGHSLLARYPETLTSATQTYPPVEPGARRRFRLRGTCLALSPRPRSSALRETRLRLPRLLDDTGHRSS